MTDVMNLATGEVRRYTLLPEEAVVAAYAQSRNDNNTWDYWKYLDKLDRRSNLTISLGDWCAFRDGRTVRSH